MRADRLREVAMGRLGVQLHDGLSSKDSLPAAPALVPPEVTLSTVGWRLRFADKPPGGRLCLAVRVRDAQGALRRTTGPFADEAGRFLWCRALDTSTVLVPFLGLPGGTSVLELVVFGLGRGPARPLGTVRLEVPPAPGLAWDAARFVRPLMVLAAAIAHADGLVRTRDRHAIERLLKEVGLSGDVGVRDVLARPTPARLGSAVCEARRRFAGWGPRTLLEQLARVAVANGAPGPAERAVLYEIAEHLDAPPEAVDRLLTGWDERPTTLPELDVAYEVLGVPRGVDREALKRAWRARMRENHPDRVPAGDAEGRARANEACAILNAAYQLLREHGTTAEPAPPRVREPDEVASDELPDDSPDAPHLAESRRGLAHWQVAMGFVALALLAFAIGLAVNDHVELAFASVVGGSEARASR